MKIRVPFKKPRNPLVAPARRRQAGRHGPGGGALRHAARRDLQREIDRMKPPH